MSMYQDETHEPQLNNLTKRLYAEGYTREHYPDYVCWGDWQNFCYKWEYLLGLTWETPCGLLIQGESEYGRYLAIADMSFNGVWYCPENDNPDIRCPFGKQDCSYHIEGLSLVRCPCHQTSKPYDYENSVEKVESERDKKVHEQWMQITGGQYCACVKGNNGYSGGYFQVEYDVQKCINFNCQNEFCSIRKQKRDLSKCNIFYDIRRTWITKMGLFDDKKVQVEKGVKIFDKPVARTDAEIWLKQYQAKDVHFIPKRLPDDRRMQFFSKHHRSWPGYDYFEFHYEVGNVRIEKARPARDLEQDLADIAEGIEVIHASDVQKAAKAEKKERKEHYKVAKAERSKRRKIRNLTNIVKTGLLEDGREATVQMKDWAEKQLKEQGVEVYEQTSLF